MSAENVLNVDYNGVIVRCSRLISWDREWVFQGPDFLFIRHRVHMVGVMHPKFNWLGVDADTKIDFNDKEMMDRLQAPRKTLKITLGEGEGVRPWYDLKLDADKGPLVVGDRLSTILGLQHMSRELVLEFCENRGKEGKKKGETDPALLSNRWEMAEDIDRTFKKSITVRGRAVFRRDELERSRREPDSYRDELLWPCQPGFKRVAQHVGVGPTGLELVYETTDLQTTVDILAEQVADIHVTHNYISTKVGNEVAAVSAIGAAVDMEIDARGAQENSYRGNRARGMSVQNAGKFAKVAAAGSRLGSLLKAGATTYNNLPKYISQITVVVEGHPHAQMQDLHTVGQQVIDFRRKQMPLSVPSSHVEFQADFTNRRITLVSVNQAAPVTQNVKMIAGQGGAENFFRSEIDTQWIKSKQHTVAKVIPTGTTKRGVGTPLYVIAKALFPVGTTPPSGQAEKARANMGRIRVGVG